MSTALQQHLLVGWTPQWWQSGSPACSECGAGDLYWRCVRGGVLHQDHCHSCTVYHKTWLSATWKDLSWPPVTEAMLEPSRPQDKTNMMWGHAVSDPLAACGWQARKRWVTTFLLPPHCPFSEAGATTLSHLKQPSIHVLTNAGAGLFSHLFSL